MSQTYSSVFPTSETPAAGGVQTSLVLVGRLLLALMFVLSGLSKLGNIGGTAGFIASAGLPLPTLLAIGAGVFELGAGLMLVLGWKARAAALLLGLFTLVASVVFHAFWALPADQQMMQQLLFMKNVSVAGGMFIVAALGAGPASIDQRRARR